MEEQGRRGGDSTRHRKRRGRRSRSKAKRQEVQKGPYRLPWLWVEGWRENLRKSGDIVEMTRWEFRVDDLIRNGRNSLPVIVARPAPGESVLRLPSSGVMGTVQPEGPRWKGRKEVRFE